MITYRDMTFCVNKSCTKECKRRLTPQIEQAAEQYGLPIAMSEFICLDEVEEGKWELKQDDNT